MTRALRLLPLFFLGACPAGDDGDDGVDTDASDTDPSGGDDLPPLTETPAGDFTCVTPAVDFAAVGWAPPQMLAADIVADQSVTLYVQDFQEETPATSRSVSLWYDNVVEGAPEVQGNVNSEAKVSLDAASCQPMSYLTKELEGLNEAVATYKAHQIFAPDPGEVTFQSVSIATYRLIPTVLGISVDPTKGNIAGTFYDCSRDPALDSSDDTGKVEGMRVRIHKCPSATSEPADCTEPVSGVVIKYFVDNFPDRDQPYTSEDGLWGIFNIPDGTYRISAYSLFDGEEKVVGGTTARVFQDSINIANIWAGYPDGVKYPSDCVEDDVVE